jgi:hypothetical protein
MSLRLSHRFSDSNVTAECNDYVSNASFWWRAGLVLKCILIQGTDSIISKIPGVDILRSPPVYLNLSQLNRVTPTHIFVTSSNLCLDLTSGLLSGFPSKLFYRFHTFLYVPPVYISLLDMITLKHWSTNYWASNYVFFSRRFYFIPQEVKFSHQLDLKRPKSVFFPWSKDQSFTLTLYFNKVCYFETTRFTA